MGFGFERPVGSAADVVELEYISALLQTDPLHLRKDGTLKAEDISLFLSSRYGIQINKEEVTQRLFDDWRIHDSLDLVTLVTLLLIPRLCQERKLFMEEENDDDDDDDHPMMHHSTDTPFSSMLESALNGLLHDAEIEETAPILTPELVQKLLLTAGETRHRSGNNPLGNTSSFGYSNNSSGRPQRRRSLQEESEEDLEEDLEENNTEDEEDEEGLEEELFWERLIHKFENKRFTTDVFVRLLTDDLTDYDRSRVNTLSTHLTDVFQATLPKVVETEEETEQEEEEEKEDESKENEEDDDENVGDGGDGENDNCDENDDNAISQQQPDRRKRLLSSRSTMGVSVRQSAEHHNVPIHFTAPFLDSTADTYRSKTLAILLWLFFLTSFFNYYIHLGIGSTLWFECDDFGLRSTWSEESPTMACRVLLSLTQWIIAVLVMGSYGILFFGLTGLGNDIQLENRAWWQPAIAAISSTIVAFFPMTNTYGLDSLAEAGRIIQVVSYLIGGLVTLINLWIVVSLAVPKRTLASWWGCCRCLWESFLFAPDAIRWERLAKRASRFKINRMIDNAIALQPEKRAGNAIDSHVGLTLLNYASSASKTQKEGGFLWTWRQLLNGNLLKNEGIFFSVRIMLINVLQLILSLLVLASGILLSAIAASRYSNEDDPIESILDTLFEVVPESSFASAVVESFSSFITEYLADNTDVVCPDNASEWELNCDPANITACLPEGVNVVCVLQEYSNRTQFLNDTADLETRAEVQELLLDASGFPVGLVENATENLLLQSGSEESLYPTERYMILLPFIVFTVVAFATAMSITLTTIPSATSTILKYRAGVMPLMNNPKQKTIRIAPDQVAYLLGSMFWGIIVASALMGGLAGCVSFLFVWQETSSTVMQLTASLIGIIAVSLLHWVFVRSFRFLTTKAFYRRRPFTANLVLLARECAFFVLTIGFVVARTLKLILTTILFIGRVDKPILNDGVGEIEAFGYRLDNTPYVWQMDVLQHEAHRHPYIETFGLMVLLKLKHGNRFASKEGTIWRRLLLFALMPWLNKYRLVTSPQLENELEDESMPMPDTSEARKKKMLRRSRGFLNLGISGAKDAMLLEKDIEIARLKKELRDLRRRKPQAWDDLSKLKPKRRLHVVKEEVPGRLGEEASESKAKDSPTLMSSRKQSVGLNSLGGGGKTRPRQPDP